MSRNRVWRLARFANCGFQFLIKLFMPKEKELQLSGGKERRLAKVKAHKERSTVATAQRLDRFSYTQNFLRRNRREWLQSPHCHLRRLFKGKVKTRRSWIQIIASHMSPILNTVYCNQVQVPSCLLEMFNTNPAVHNHNIQGC